MHPPPCRFANGQFLQVWLLAFIRDHSESTKQNELSNQTSQRKSQELKALPMALGRILKPVLGQINLWWSRLR